jgi:outer membrane cobalamin receptor
MNRYQILLLALLIAVSGITVAQPRPDAGSATVTGTVFDEDLGVPIEYANIVIYQQSGGLQVNGTVTDPAGKFVLTGLKPDRYYLEMSFIGYESRTVKDLQFAPGARLDIGVVRLPQVLLAVEGAEAVADRPVMIHKIDKKVIEVSRMATAASGTAVEVLENVSSVAVDIEGNISLRGSENFTVLIDGRPSILDPGDALQQIPASTIKSIEIITNPSAKYNPDGVSGIINIVMKKQRGSGLSGLFNANVGLDNKYGGDFLLSGHTGIVTAFIGADYNKREYPGTRTAESWTSHGDTAYTSSDGATIRDRPSHGVRAGLDLRLGSADVLSLGGSYGGRRMDGTNVLDFVEWAVPGDTGNYLSDGGWHRRGTHVSLNLDHRHEFGADGHNVLARASWGSRNAEEEASTELHNDSTRTDTLSGWRTTETGTRDLLTFKLDYALPLRKTDKLEAGYQSQLRWSGDTSKAYEYSPASDSYELRSGDSHSTEYTRNIHSLYSLYSGGIGDFGFQAGLRGEYTDRAIELVGEDSVLTIDRVDYFPTLHLTYQLPAAQQVMASYTRRTQRPRWWYLEPFPTWSDAYNIRQGNPALKPEYIDSYEASYQLPFGPNMLSAEVYYRVIHDKIERVRSVYARNVILHSFENVGTDYALGTEVAFSYSPFGWWTVNLTGTAYDYRVEGTLDGSDFERTSFNWRARFGNEFKFPTGTRLQVNGSYTSPTVSAQGKLAGFPMTDVAVKQEFLNRSLSVTLQVRDVLSTGVHEFTSGGEEFYSHMVFRRKSPVVMLNVSYNFNNFRPPRRQPAEEEDDEGEYD